jgi:hypothetical protein
LEALTRRCAEKPSPRPCLRPISQYQRGRGVGFFRVASRTGPMLGSQVHHDVVRGAGQDCGMRFIKGVGLNMRQVGRHK